MTEVHYIFFSMLALLLLLYSFKAEHHQKKYFILSGIAFGCALTSKLLSVEFSILFVGIILLNSLFKKQTSTSIDKKQILKITLMVFTFFLISVLAFLLTEPGFYKNPLVQITTMKTDMDNYNRDVWFIAYPTIQGLQPTRMLLLFDYTLFPSPIEHQIPGAYPNSTFDLGWNHPLTNSSIVMTIFFFIGFVFLIQKVKKFKDNIPEMLTLIWFGSTFFTTLMIARDFSLERYLLPFLISIIIISSYGLWSFARGISGKRTKIGFITSFLIAHAITSMSYWERIYSSPGTFWTNPLPYGTLQQSLTNPLTLIVNAVFIAFFIYLIIIRFQNKIKDAKIKT